MTSSVLDMVQSGGLARPEHDAWPTKSYMHIGGMLMESSTTGTAHLFQPIEQSEDGRVVLNPRAMMPGQGYVFRLAGEPLLVIRTSQDSIQVYEFDPNPDPPMWGS